MKKANPSASKNCFLFIESPKNGRRRRILPRKTRAGSRVPGRTMPACPAWLAHRPAPAPGPCVCNKSYIATPAAWRVDTPAALILKVFAAAGLPYVRYVRAARAGQVDFFGLRLRMRGRVELCMRGAARGRVIVNRIAWPDRRAGARARALIFCVHCFNSHKPPRWP